MLPCGLQMRWYANIRGRQSNGSGKCICCRAFFERYRSGDEAGFIARCGIPSFATHVPEAGCDIRTVQKSLGHEHVESTMIYTRMPKRGGRGMVSTPDP